MKVYVASALSNWARAALVMRALEGRGHEITHDWTALYCSGAPKPDDLSDQQVAAVLAADALVLVTPAARGAHVEYGVAVGAGRKTVVLLADGVKSIGFYRVTTSTVVGTLDECLDAVEGRKEKA